MDRRAFLQTLAATSLAAVAGGGYAAASDSVSVVKFLLFSCPICRAAENVDGALASAVTRQGGRFVHAPLPMDGDFGAQFVYAARVVSSEFEVMVRNSLYKGVQDMGIPMDEAFRVMVWLQQDLGSAAKVDWAELLQQVSSKEVVAAMRRSVALAEATGVANTPSYVFVQGNRPQGIVDPSTATPTNSVPALRDAVLKKLTELSNK